ncbi:MAG: prolyl oligopeptidase family serine peptidase [Melioribacteraceae bacterium]|nr:prolyl oligopeptidase family serine peptidase [Melioribacteraceae bacterium]
MIRYIIIIGFFGNILFASGNSINLKNGNSIFIKHALCLHFEGMNRRSLSQRDVIEEMLVNGSWKSPSEGESFRIDTTLFKWENIETDTSGWFKTEKLASGYAYVQIDSDKEKMMILEGSGYSMAYINGEPRIGNVYKFTEERNPWEPEFGFVYLPVKLKKGKNEFLFQCYYGRMNAVLHDPASKILINNIDLTIPDLLVNEKVDHFGGLVIVNASDKMQDNLILKTYGEGFNETITKVPSILSLSTRKVKFGFSANPFIEKENKNLTVEVLDNSGKILDKNSIEIRVLNNDETHRRTFISNIDGSVQYYAVNPARNDNKENLALFFALHGAAVEGLNHANSYYAKTWGLFVSPTNRRPYGFNWEDWGRMDALEVLDIAMKNYSIDENRVYLTGHSMGGHGTWHIGGTFPDRFAAIGPSAGWISFWSYRYRNTQKTKSKVKQLIDRTGNPSDTYTIAKNYEQLGIYIIHGSADDNVRATQSHSMIDTLKKFHKDFTYHEEPGAGHWWDNSDERGADCVDWPELFDFFARHARPAKERIKHVKFVTASPGISAKNNWITIYSQEKYFGFSNVDILFDAGVQRFKGTTENVSTLALDTEILDNSRELTIVLDDQKIENIDIKSLSKVWLKKIRGKWNLTSEPSKSVKGPHRYGSFKDVFKNNMVFVYGTKGTKEENEWAINKVRYDAEQFWYQGNGAIELVADKDFDPIKFKDRNVILYGNSETNSAWDDLLSEAPINVTSKKVTIGSKEFVGDDLVMLMIFPKQNSDVACVGTVAATGLKGMRLTNNRSYLKPGITYPDFVLMNSELLSKDDYGYKAAGFFDDEWSLKKAEVEFSN